MSRHFNGSLSVLCISVSVLLLLQVVHSSIIAYKNHALLPGHPEYLVFPKFAKGDAPNWWPGNGHSFLDLGRINAKVDCTVSKGILSSGKPYQCVNNTVFDVLMFESPGNMPWVDYWEDHQYCCNFDQIAAGYCTAQQKGRLIVPSLLPGVISQSLVLSLQDEQNMMENTVLGHHEIDVSAEYVVFLAVCDEHGSPVSISGEIDSLEPYGYLPGDMFGNLPFYGGLSLVYAVVGVIWVIVCTIYKEEVISIQYWISGVLVLGMFETSMLYMHYLHWNDYGSPSLWLMVGSLVLGVSKRTLSRVVVQLVALGYGIVRPTLGEEMLRVLYLGAAYFGLSLVYGLAVTLPSTSSQEANDPAYDLLSLAVFMLAGIDTTFYIWIISSINSLLQTLAARKQGAKYLLYRHFRSVLFISIFFTFVWALYSFKLEYEDVWQSRWTADAMWEVTYLVVFIAIAFLWGPSRNIQRYASSMELSQLEDDEEYLLATQIEMTSSEHNKNNNSNNNNNSGDSLDSEYGGKLNDENDPFQGSGALDTATAITKKA